MALITLTPGCTVRAPLKAVGSPLWQQPSWMIFSKPRLENCCHCDYIAVYDGPSVHSRHLGTLCHSNKTLNFFQSSSTYMTVVFRTDSSAVARGFNAEFSSSVPASSGQWRMQEVHWHEGFILIHEANSDPTKSSKCLLIMSRMALKVIVWFVPATTVLLDWSLL